MAEVICQVTRFHKGFHGPGHTSLDTALGILKTKLKTITGPYAFRDKPKKTFDLKGALAEAKKRAPKLDMRERLIIFGHDTGQHSIALRRPSGRNWNLLSSRSRSSSTARRCTSSAHLVLQETVTAQVWYRKPSRPCSI